MKLAHTLSFTFVFSFVFIRTTDIDRFKSIKRKINKPGMKIAQQFLSKIALFWCKLCYYRTTRTSGGKV